MTNPKLLRTPRDSRPRLDTIMVDGALNLETAPAEAHQ
jgi:hypothetical protein